jgi:hypothetical protein
MKSKTKNLPAVPAAAAGLRTGAAKPQRKLIQPKPVATGPRLKIEREATATAPSAATTAALTILLLLCLVLPGAAQLIQPPVGGTAGYYPTRLLVNLAASETTNRLYYTNASLAFGNTNSGQVNLKSNAVAGRWEWRSGTTVLATNTQNRATGTWRENASGAALYGYSRYEPTATQPLRLNALGEVIDSNFWTVNAGSFPGGSGLDGQALDDSLRSGTNHFKGQVTSTNRAGYFGPSNSTATNREPYWSGQTGANQTYSLLDAWGHSIIGIEPKVPGGGGYIYYWGSKTNSAQVWQLSDTPRDGNEPRAGFNFIYDSGELIGEVHYQWMFRTNNLKWYNGETDSSHEALRFGNAGDLTIGSRPFCYMESSSGSQLSSVGTSPTTVGTFSASQSRFWSANTTTGGFTNLVAITNCPIAYWVNIVGDEAENDTYYAQIFSNNVALGSSLSLSGIPAGFANIFTKKIVVTAPSNTWWQLKVFTQGGTRAAAISGGIISAGWE